MARRNPTYAIRLAVEGGGQVKAELVSVGQSGEQSLKRIESAGERASGGLKGLGRQAELLRTGIRTLGGALIGVTTAGGLAALVDRSISAADAIGKTADKIGVGVEALQELRFAAKASGVEQQTLDMALQRFTRRAAEAAQGTGEAKDALAQMGIALRDQSGNLRRSEDLLGEVADAFAGIEDPAERVRLSVRGALEMLAAAYTFDAVESDHQLKFKKRGRSPSRVIPEQDLVPVNAEREAFIETRAQEVDLPARFTVVYQDLERDADIGTQYAKRPDQPELRLHVRRSGDRLPRVCRARALEPRVRDR
jgi:Putative phage tail protein